MITERVDPEYRLGMLKSLSGQTYSQNGIISSEPLEELPVLPVFAYLLLRSPPMSSYSAGGIALPSSFLRDERLFGTAWDLVAIGPHGYNEGVTRSGERLLGREASCERVPRVGERVLVRAHAGQKMAVKDGKITRSLSDNEMAEVKHTMSADGTSEMESTGEVTWRFVVETDIFGVVQTRDEIDSTIK
jgi:hypothetical protein